MINKIKIIAVGKIKEHYLLQGINEFLKRLNIFCKIEVIEIKDLGMKKEAEKLTPKFQIVSKKYGECPSLRFLFFRDNSIAFISISEIKNRK